MSNQQPKKNVNTAAIKAWEQNQKSNLPTIPDRPKRQKRRRRRLGAKRNCTASDIAVDTQSPQPQHISETPSHKTSSSNSPHRNSRTSRLLEQIPSTSTFDRQNISVQISQHSSFDRDLYIAYQSSSSTQGNSSLLPPRPNPRLGESSPPATSPARTTNDNGVIPDSQSLPGSSSYKPTSSTCSAVSGPDQTPLIHHPRVSHYSTDLESFVGEVAEAIESSEDSPAVVVAASQPAVIASQRSRSEPAPNITELSSVSSSEARFPSLPRSTSDPTSTYQDRRQIFVSGHSSDHHIIGDQGFQTSVDFQSSHRAGVGHILIQAHTKVTQSTKALPTISSSRHKSL